MIFQSLFKMSAIFVWIFAFLGLVPAIFASERKLTTSLNPGCTEPECLVNGKWLLVHVAASSHNDTLHHIWDFTGQPTILLALTPLGTNLTVDWAKYASTKQPSIIFSKHPIYMFATLLSKVGAGYETRACLQLYDFNDANNTGELDVTNDNSSYITGVVLSEYNWNITKLTNNSQFTELTVKGHHFQDKEKKNGSITISVSAYGWSDHGSRLPHLHHTGNTSQLEVGLTRMRTRHHNSRFALQVVSLSSDPPGLPAPQLESRKTLDDEHAPGVFTFVELLTAGARPEGRGGGYMQWRPVVYTSETHDMTNSTETMQYIVQPLTAPSLMLNATLFHKLAGYQLDNFSVNAVNISFGVSDDGYYRKTNYAYWTFMLGYGTPPTEHFSMLVILVLCIGLGLPALLIAGGALFVVCRRLNRNKDDLFMAR